MGMFYGMFGMACLIIGYWADASYTYDHGIWLVAAAMAPGIVVGLWSAVTVELTGLPELVGAYNGFGGLAAALEGIGLYLDPNATLFIRGGQVIGQQTLPMLWVQAVGLCLSIIIGSMTFTGSFVAVLKLHGNISSKPRVVPYRWLLTIIVFCSMIVLSVMAFSGGQTWNDRGAGLACIVLLTILSSVYGIISVMAIGGGECDTVFTFRSIPLASSLNHHVVLFR
jgi:NAD/NADP transhydrogenase beta subunit